MHVSISWLRNIGTLVLGFLRRFWIHCNLWRHVIYFLCCPVWHGMRRRLCWSVCFPICHKSRCTCTPSVVPSTYTSSLLPFSRLSWEVAYLHLIQPPSTYTISSMVKVTSVPPYILPSAYSPTAMIGGTYITLYVYLRPDSHWWGCFVAHPLSDQLLSVRHGHRKFCHTVCHGRRITCTQIMWGNTAPPNVSFWWFSRGIVTPLDGFLVEAHLSSQGKGSRHKYGGREANRFIMQTQWWGGSLTMFTTSMLDITTYIHGGQIPQAPIIAGACAHMLAESHTQTHRHTEVLARIISEACACKIV